MNKRERVIAAMNGKEADHVPAGFWFHFNGGDAAGDACVQAHLNYYRETDLDFVKIMCDRYFPFPLPEISSPADWKKVKPLPKEHPFIGFETHWDGTVQEGVIYKGTKEKLQTYTKLLIQNYGKTGLMLGGDCTVDARIDRQRIRWIVEAARSL